MVLIISIHTVLLLSIFGIFNVLSQCFNKNAQCSIIYNDGKCMFYGNNQYYDLSALYSGINNVEIFPSVSVFTMDTQCGNYWSDIYNSSASTKCSNENKNKYIWPVGECGCPLCECPPQKLCCYQSADKFDINMFDANSVHIQCTDDEDMCSYDIDADGSSYVSCSDRNFLFNYLSINVSLPSSTILAENNNVACYTFIDTNTTKLQCFCGDDGCNDLNGLNTPDLKPKNGCYVSDSYHTEEFWADYVYEDISCEMCSISLYETNNALKSDMKCKARSDCYSLLTEYDSYNDELFGCVTISNTSSNVSTSRTITTECCCDPSIHGNLCNKDFLKSKPKNAIIFGCWKADFFDITNSEWDKTAQRINCSTEFHEKCVIQSFGGNKYSSDCETALNCNNTKNAMRICCDGIEDDFCNQPGILQKSSAKNNCYFIINLIISIFICFLL